MSNPAQVLSRHRKTPLPPVVPARQALVSWTTGNQNGRSILYYIVRHFLMLIEKYT